MDLICFSHLRWNFVYQRPQHLISRFARNYRVFFIEEAVNSEFDDSYTISLSKESVWIVIPQLKNLSNGQNIVSRQCKVLNRLFNKEQVENYFFWYYTPMSLLVSDHFHPKLIIYDCMDELSAFKFADPMIKNLEKELLKKADIVFTGGYSLYQSKKNQHPNIHLFASSIDKAHFSKARLVLEDELDQANIPHPRLGFFGVIDERFDANLISKVASLKPEWHFVIIGPIVKIDPDTLPTSSNIHYLGTKSCDILPNYLSGWDIALIPFALNEATRYISPTKTPEYLAAGKPVISTAINDVVYPYGEKKLVHIVATPEAFIEKATIELNEKDRKEWIANIDNHLANNSWNKTWFNMHELIKNEIHTKQNLVTSKKEKVYV